MRRSNEKTPSHSKPAAHYLPIVEELSAHTILSIFESVPGLHLILKPDAPKFTVIAVNDAYAKATMTKREEILGKGLFEVFPDNPKDPHATGVKNLTSSFMSVLKKKKPHRMQIQKYDIRKIKSNEFEERYWDPLNVPVLDKQGNVSYIVHSVVDVTRTIVAEENEKNAEARATKQEHRADQQEAINQELSKTNQLLNEARNESEHLKKLYEVVTASTPDLIYVFDLKYRITYANDALLKMWGIKTLKEAVGKRLTELGYEKWHAKMHEREIDQVVATKQSTRGTVSFPHATKGARIYDYIFAPVLNTKGEVEAVAGTSRDITELKQVDEAQKRLAAAVESSDDAIISQDIDGTITSWNKGAEELYGYKADEIIGKPVSILIPIENKNDFPNILNQLKQGKKIEHYETKRRAKDGRVIDVSLTVSPIRNTEGKIIGASKIARDITHRKKIEERQKFLEEVSNKLVTSLDNEVTLQDIGKLIVSYIADYCRIALIDDNKQIKEISVNHSDPTKVSLAAELYENYKNRPEYTSGIPHILKTGKAEIIEKIDKKVIDSLKNNPNLIKVIKQIGLKSYMGVPLIAREKVIGAITFSSISAHRYYSKEDLHFAEELAHRIALAIDNIRLYHKAQLELKERKQAELNLKYLAEASKVLSSSLDFKTTLRNIAKLAVPEVADWCAIDLLTDNGLEQVAIVHKDPKKVKWAKELRENYPPDMNTETGIAKVIKTCEAEYYPSMPDEMLINLAKDKKHLKLLEQVGFTSAMIVPLFRQRKCMGAMTFVSAEAKRQYSMSDLHMAQELAARASLALDNAMLYKASLDAVTLRDDFISVASHELKTPVTSVKIFTEVLKKHSEQIGDKKASDHLSKMNKQLDKLTDLIYNMLNISKIQAGRLEFDQRRFDFDLTVKEIRDVLQEGATNHKLIIKGKTNKQLYGDEDRIGQVVSNLISNAVKYSPKADKVIIHLSSTNSEIIVCVEDFGIGMAKEHGERIFERFYRVFDTTDKTFPGLGIGLYISSEIIKRHHGRLWVESDSGHGSKFYFSLPLKRDKKPNGVKVL